MNPLNVFFVLLYNFSVLFGSVWLVLEHEWSLWTIFFAVLFLVNIENKSK